MFIVMNFEKTSRFLVVVKREECGPPGYFSNATVRIQKVFNEKCDRNSNSFSGSGPCGFSSPLTSAADVADWLTFNQLEGTTGEIIQCLVG